MAMLECTVGLVSGSGRELFNCCGVGRSDAVILSLN
jgi:hypothetical protein